MRGMRLSDSLATLLLPSLQPILRLSAVQPRLHKELNENSLLTFSCHRRLTAGFHSPQLKTISVAASAVPRIAEIFEFVASSIKKVELKIKVFTDYVQPNVQVAVAFRG
jgi:hypothetical protein